MEGDIKAQFLLYKQYSKAMYNIAVRFMNNTMDAEDVLQESFVTAFEKLDKLENPKLFSAWLRRIVVNNCISILRKRKIYFEELEERTIVAEDYDDVNAGIDPAIVHKAIKELPEGGRTILVLYALEGYKHREIAEMLNISESTSRTQYSRALKILKESLKHKIYVN